METNLPDVFAATGLRGDVPPDPWVHLSPARTTAHKQGRVAGETAVVGDRLFQGSLGTQVVKIFEVAAARTVLREEDVAAGHDPLTVG